MKAAMGKLTRDDMLSCSQLPALCGVSEYQTPNDILRYCISAIKGEPVRIDPNEAMGWGSRLEGSIVDEAAERLGMELEHGFDKPFVADGIPLQCSLDAKITPILKTWTIKTDPDHGIFVMNDTGELTVSSPGLLESKLTSVSPENSPSLSRGPIQLQGQMICTGCTWGAVAILYRGTEMRIFVFEQHPATREAIIAAAKEFEARLMSYHEHGVEEWYPIASAEDGSRVFPSSKKEPAVELPEQAITLAAEIADAQQMIKAYENRVETATASLMNMMGEHEVATAGSYRITWGSRSYKAQPEKIVPAKPAYTVRAKSVQIKRDQA